MIAPIMAENIFFEGNSIFNSIPELSETPGGRRKSNPEQINKVIRKASKSFKKINVKQDATSTPDDYDEEREVLKMTFSQNPFNTMINKKHLSIDSPGLFLILNYIVFYKFYMKK